MRNLLIFCLFIYSTSSWAVDFYRVNNNQTVLINEHSVSKNVNNNACGMDIFVPTKTAAEWTDFRTNKPACISLTDPYDCAPTTLHSHSLPGRLNGQSVSFQEPNTCGGGNPIFCQAAWHQYTCSGTSFVDNGYTAFQICVCSTCECP